MSVNSRKETSLTENPTETVQAVTTLEQTVQFHTDDSVVTKGLDRVMQPDPAIRADLREAKTHGIHDFLQRPVVVATGNWTTSMSRNQNLVSLPFPETLLTVPMVAEKMQGFLGLRATVCVRVQINAMRFTQGRLLMHYVPLGQIQIDRMDVIDQSIALKTQTPRVEIDAATTTAAIIRMPYVSPMTHFNLHTFQGPIGVFQLCVYSPLVDPSGSGSVAYTVWAHLEDIELEFPAVRFDPSAPDVTVPQMSDPFRDVTVPQMDVAQKIGAALSAPPAEYEINSDAATGTATKVLRAVSGAAKSLSSVPLLTPFAKPAAWLTGIAANIAAAFGWSNPLNTANAGRLTVHQFSYSANVNAGDQSYPLSLLADNSVAVMPGSSGTSIDEMSFAYLSRIPSFIRAFSWGHSDGEGTTLWSFDIGHLQFAATRAFSDSVGSITVYDKPPFAYLMDHFKFWRSSLVFTFKFIKTEFHSGRVRIAFSPVYTDTIADSDRFYLYQEVLDIRESNEFTVTVPYVSTLPYLRTMSAPPTADLTPVPTSPDIMGILTVEVLNTLEAPSTVSSSVEVLVELSAGPDFEVAVPCSPNFLPVFLGSLVAPVMLDKTVPQMALGENATEDDRSGRLQQSFTSLAATSLGSGGMASAKYCIGERILSLRQLMKRSTPWFTATTSTSTSYFRCLFRPWSTQVLVLQSGSAAIHDGPAPDYWNVFSPLYTFVRGGMRIRMLGVDQASDCYYRSFLTYLVTTAPISSAAAFVATPPTGTNVGEIGEVLHSRPANGGLELNIPQYHQCQSFLVDYGDVYGLNNAPQCQYINNNAVLTLGVGAFKQQTAYRQMAEDTDLGFFLGVLPTISQADFAARNNTTVIP